MSKKVWIGIGAGIILFLAGVGFSQMVMMGKHRPKIRDFRCVQCECVAGDKDCRCEMCKAPKIGHKKHQLKDGAHQEAKIDKKKHRKDEKRPGKEMRHKEPRPAE